MMRFSRREFTALAGASLLASAARRNVPVALQLYSLQRECKQDIEGTLARVGKLGFKAVEWYGWGGYFGKTPKELRRMLEKAKLKSASDHIHMTALLGERFDQTSELHKTLGTKVLTLSELLGNRQAKATAKFWEQGAEQMNQAAEKLKKHGIRLGLHNHAVEFQKVDDGRLPWDIVFDRTSKDIAQQLDLAGVVGAGLDPCAYIKKYPGRTLSIHMKDYSPGRRQLLIGEGDVKWKELFEVAESVGGVRWYIVEQESYPPPLTPFEAVEKSAENLRKLLSARA
jgi:sugar phosphate isomerase/epimerase